MPKSALLTDENQESVMKIRNLFKELVETCCVLDDKDTLASTRQSEKDVKAGRIRNYSEFIEELKKLGEI